MQGYPKHLNSRQDVLNLLAMPEHAERTRSDLARLLDSRFAWVAVSELPEGKAGLEDDTHKVVAEEGDGRTIRIQMALVEDPRAQIFRIGLTVDEAEAMIQEGDHA